MKIENCQLATGAAPRALDAGTINQLRTISEDMKTACLGLEDILEEPLKSQFARVRQQVGAYIATLPDEQPDVAAIQTRLGRAITQCEELITKHGASKPAESKKIGLC